MQQTLILPEDVEGKPHGLQKVRLKKTSRLNRLQDCEIKMFLCLGRMSCLVKRKLLWGKNLFSSVFQSFSIFLFY